MNNTETNYDLIKYADGDLNMNLYYDKLSNTLMLTVNQMSLLLERDASSIRKQILKLSEQKEFLENNRQKIHVVGVKQKVTVYTKNVLNALGGNNNSIKLKNFIDWSTNFYNEIKTLDNSTNNDSNENISNFSENSYELVRFEDGDFSLDVKVSPQEDTVWLSKEQICVLFDTTRQNLEYHIDNIYIQNELTLETTCKKILQVQLENNRNVTRQVLLYNLDMIISLGYRINSKNGIIFRRWASSILKEYLLKGYKINENRCLNCASSIIELNNKVIDIEKRITNIIERIDDIEETIYSKDAQIFFEGEIFEPNVLFKKLFLLSKKEIIIIDGYADSSLLELLNGIDKPITIITFTNSKLNKTKLPSNIKLILSNVFHDRYIIIDEFVYNMGISFNGVGKKRFTVTELKNIEKSYLLSNIKLK